MKLLKELIPFLRRAVDECVPGELRDSLITSLRTVVSAVEELPIHTDDVINRPLFFVLVAGEWWPCTAGREGQNGWLNYRIDMLEGASESGVAAQGTWAHATADNQPNYHWCDDILFPSELIHV